MTRARLVVVLLAVGCAGPSHIDLGPVPKGVVVDARVQYYDLSAATLAELRRDMARLGPRWNGRAYQAVTASRFRWEFVTTRNSSQFCAAENVKVTMTTVVVFPRWNPTAEPDSATLEWWQQLNTGLMEHERGHASLSLRTAGDIARSIEDIPPTSCDLLERRVTELGRERILNEWAQQAQYDQDTRHGATQIERVIRLRSP